MIVIENVGDQSLHEAIFHAIHLDCLRRDYHYHHVILIEVHGFSLFLVFSILIGLLFVSQGRSRFQVPLGFKNLETVLIAQERLSVY
jgi:hypothetical protein